jgi:magnesium transporter
MVLAMTVSGLTGTLVPMLFKKLKVDPAVASGPLITTINDLVAVISYYGLAWLILINWMQVGV